MEEERRHVTVHCGSTRIFQGRGMKKWLKQLAVGIKKAKN
jgi:hypothetical protein